MSWHVARVIIMLCVALYHMSNGNGQYHSGTCIAHAAVQCIEQVMLYCIVLRCADFGGTGGCPHCYACVAHTRLFVCCRRRVPSFVFMLFRATIVFCVAGTIRCRSWVWFQVAPEAFPRAFPRTKVNHPTALNSSSSSSREMGRDKAGTVVRRVTAANAMVRDSILLLHELDLVTRLDWRRVCVCVCLCRVMFLLR